VEGAPATVAPYFFLQPFYHLVLVNYHINIFAVWQVCYLCTYKHTLSASGFTQLQFFVLKNVIDNNR
jgi:hypothetical protein